MKNHFRILFFLHIVYENLLFKFYSVRNFNFVSIGMCIKFSHHDKKNPNPYP